jgi:hypothetical protein
MTQENNDVEELLAMFPCLNFTEKEPVLAKRRARLAKKKVLLTLEDVLEEFPELNFDYGTVAYFARKYPLLPDEMHQVFAENFEKAVKK